jgi:hypothetical protein
MPRRIERLISHLFPARILAHPSHQQLSRPSEIESTKRLFRLCGPSQLHTLAVLSRLELA